MTAPALLTPKEAAAFLQLTEKTLEKWRSKGIGPKFRRMGHRTVRYSQDDLITWPGMVIPSAPIPAIQRQTIHDLPGYPTVLIDAGRRTLSRAMASIMVEIAKELSSAERKWNTHGKSVSALAGLPEWIQAMGSQTLSGGTVCWQTLQDHLTQRTATLLAELQLADNVTGGGLANFLAIDLEALAREGWAPLVQSGAASVEESR